MGSASDYFADESRFRERVAVTPGDVLRGPRVRRPATAALGGIVASVGSTALDLPTVVEFAGVLVGLGSAVALAILGVVVVLSLLHATRLFVRVNVVDGRAVRVLDRRPWGTVARTIPGEEVLAADPVAEGDARPPGVTDESPIQTDRTDSLTGVVDAGVRIETGDAEFFLRSRRPDEFAAAVEELVARADRDPDRDQFGVSTGGTSGGSPVDGWAEADSVTARDPTLEAESDRK